MLTDAILKLFSFCCMCSFLCAILCYGEIGCTEAGGRVPILRGGWPLASSLQPGFRDMQVVSEEPVRSCLSLNFLTWQMHMI